MKRTLKVKETIPEAQKAIIVEALNLLEKRLKKKDKKQEDSDIGFKLFDITTLISLMESCEVNVELSMEDYEKFSSISPVDFPIYVQTKKS